MFSPEQWKALDLALQRHIGEALRCVAPTPRSCMTCRHFTESPEMCNRYGQRPPARIIANGCPDWIEDDCPL